MVSFSLTPKQEEQRDLASSRARHILAFGGSRSGKTFGFTRCVIARAFMAPGSRHGIFRLHNVDIRQSVMMDTFPAVMDVCWPGVPYDLNKSDQFATLPNGSEIWFGGLDDKSRVEKILGKEYSTIYANECSQIPFASILTLRTRLAQSADKIDGRPLALKAYYDLNPVGFRHWTFSEFHKHESPVDQTPINPATRATLQMNPADNPHLRAEYLEELAGLPEAERRRFERGDYQSDLPNSLWPMDRVDASRVHCAPPLERIVVSVDPSGSDGVGGDSQGITASGKSEGHAYLLEDASARLSPAQWGKVAVDLYHKWGADLIVAEVNYGGAMVENTIKMIDPTVKFKAVHASRGKHIRAEPVAALYEETGSHPPRVHHVGHFPELEDQLGQFTTEGYQGAGSPDRADSLVWGITELMLGDLPQYGMLPKRSNSKRAA